MSPVSKASESPQTSPATQLDADARASLEAIGYVNSVRVSKQDENKAGVLRFDRERASKGLNLFNPRFESAAYLMDLEGNIRHRWQHYLRGDTQMQFRARFADRAPEYLDGWSFTRLLPEGDLLVLGSHHLLMRLDSESRLKWKLDLSVHHDAAVAENGDLYVLADSLRTARLDRQPVAFQDNQIIVVSPDGEIRKKISLFDAMTDDSWRSVLDGVLQEIISLRSQRLIDLRDSAPESDRATAELARLYDEASRGDFDEDPGIKNVLFHAQVEDIFHSNSIQIIPADQRGLWRRGDYLISVCYLNRIVVIDQDTEKVIWSWGEGVLDRAHHATQLENGNIMIFDNGSSRDHSRILEINPTSGEIVWRYESEPKEDFFTLVRGGSQPLPNGNILISETDKGYVFEITRGGEKVWEYFAKFKPILGSSATSTQAKRRGAIYRMIRLDTEDPPFEKVVAW